MTSTKNGSRDVTSKSATNAQLQTQKNVFTTHVAYG